MSVVFKKKRSNTNKRIRVLETEDTTVEDEGENLLK